jgi:ketosteroid isomerase-like protein
MSQQNVEIVRGCLEAWQRGDRATAMESLAPDIEINLVGAAVGGEVFHGHEGVREAVEGFDSAWDRSEFEFGDLLDAGDHVVARFRHHLRGRASGIDVVARYTAVFTVRDGRIVRFRDFASRRAALEAAGLRE